ACYPGMLPQFEGHSLVLDGEIDVVLDILAGQARQRFKAIARSSGPSSGCMPPGGAFPRSSAPPGTGFAFSSSRCLPTATGLAKPPSKSLGLRCGGFLGPACYLTPSGGSRSRETSSQRGRGPIDSGPKRL